MMRRADVERDVLQFLAICGFDVFPRSGSSRSQSHIWGVQRHSGRHLEVTCTAPGHVPSREQLAWLDLMRSNHAIAFWVDSVAMCRKHLERGIDS